MRVLLVAIALAAGLLSTTSRTPRMCLGHEATIVATTFPGVVCLSEEMKPVLALSSGKWIVASIILWARIIWLSLDSSRRRRVLRWLNGR